MSERWAVNEANDWYERQPWLVGSNFIPSTAINQLEMWQADTFDPATIDRELGWAESLGFTSMRVFLHDLLWDADTDGFAAHIDAYLAIADAHHISTMFVLFDDCWHPGAKLGPQPSPVPGKHNSGWLQGPGHAVIAGGAALPRLEAYVKGVVRRFAGDRRVIAWDIYNEIGNGFLLAQGLPKPERAAALERAVARRAEALPKHLELLDLAFEWARSTGPSQPCTAGLFMPDRALNEHLAAASDVTSFHCYEPAERLEALIARLTRHERPLICTEYMARTMGSDFRAHLPVYERERIGCYNWGLVNGKTQTHIAWSGDASKWFHDIFHADGTPYDADEVAFIRETCLKNR